LELFFGDNKGNQSNRLPYARRSSQNVWILKNLINRAFIIYYWFEIWL